ncbi:MAG TPA: MEDS domain-containing protein [Burkholderiales bacterium]|nr:MEDS domain-containing protein [Burkholderiales bacterium]
MNPASFPSEGLRRQLEALGIARERHCLGDLIAMLPARLDGRPYEDFDADCVAEVIVYLVSKGVLDAASLEAAGLHVEWGERLCHFYRHEDELLGLLGPFFRQGLARNERCLWLAGPATTDKARDEIGLLAEVLEEGDCALPREERRAVAQGYNGLRVAGEALVLDVDMPPHRMKALATYRSGSLQPAQIVLLLRAHDGALVKRRGGWHRVRLSA